jgi:hypothetical protein
MFYTGLDPFTMKPVYVPKSADEKRMQRALLQCADPKNADLVRTALKMCHREDLIGYDKKCLVKPSYKDRVEQAKKKNNSNQKRNSTARRGGGSKPRSSGKRR